MSLLDDRTWEGKIFSGGWVDGSGGTAAVVEPATGDELGRIGAATPADVSKAAERAADVQRGWGRLPYDQRAAVLRNAAQLFVEHQAELDDWIVRESRCDRSRVSRRARWPPRSAGKPPRWPRRPTATWCAPTRSGSRSPGNSRSAWSG